MSRGAHSRMLRIIGGAWRGRRFRFAPLDEIRPTPDRVRETLFNWLGGRITQARCLDLFAGSGALGLEALSRGAARVVFIEQAQLAERELSARLIEWGARGAQALRADALTYLRGAHGAPEPFDVVFLDPPFAQQLLAPAAALLEERGWLAEAALIYVERPAGEDLSGLPATWKPARAKRAGEVGYHLYVRGDTGGAGT